MGRIISPSAAGLTPHHSIRASFKGFSPMSLAGIAWWHKASLGLTLVETAVSAWGDQTGNEHHLAETTARPVYTANALNGRPGLLFDQKRMVFPTPVVSATAFTFMVVLKPTSSLAYQTLLNNSYANSPQLYRYLTNQLVGFYGQAPSSRAGSTVTVNQGSILVFRLDHSSLYCSMSVNGGTPVEYTGSSVFAGAWTSIGSVSTSPTTNPYIGYWMEDIMYDRVLEAAEEKQLVRQLGSYYGITVA
jgi:hypothetical protein